MSQSVLAIIMGGGRGSRLSPLTKERCKPAVPLAGKYRLVDIPISNCLNSGINRMYVLTQFNTASLHRHIIDSYKFDPFGGGFVDILSAEQTEETEAWYQGTADAVRQNLHHFADHAHDLVLILSGDQLYRMDFRKIIAQHIQSGAEVTLAAKPIPVSKVKGLGLMKVNDELEINGFAEKPTDPKVIESLQLSPEVEQRAGYSGSEPRCLASMGIYVFNRKVLFDSLQNTMLDFGKEIIPGLLGQSKLYSYIFDDYWEDIGTVHSFFEANLQLTDVVPPFNFFLPGKPIYTHARYLPASKLNSCQIDQAIIADGCIITRARIKRSVIGVRSIVGENVEFDNVVMMGSDHFEELEKALGSYEGDIPPIGVGANSKVSNAIIDKNARIGKNCVLSPEGKPDMYQEAGLFVRDGVLVVCKNAVVPDNTIF